MLRTVGNRREPTSILESEIVGKCDDCHRYSEHARNDETHGTIFLSLAISFCTFLIEIIVAAGPPLFRCTKLEKVAFWKHRRNFIGRSRCILTDHKVFFSFAVKLKREVSYLSLALLKHPHSPSRHFIFASFVHVARHEFWYEVGMNFFQLFGSCINF